MPARAAVVCTLLATALALPALASPAGAQENEGTVEVRLVPNLAGAPSRLDVEASGQRFQSGGEVPRSVSVLTPRGARFDPRAVAVRCSSSQAQAFACPEGSRIGRGIVEGTFGGPLVLGLLGGAQEFEARIDIFLAPARRGEVAGVVVQARETRSGARGTARGSLTLRRAGRFGARLRFELPRRQPFPPGFTVDVRRLELAVGASRRVAGVRRTLLRNPPVCRGTFPYQLRVSFESRTVVRNGGIPCRARAARRPSFAG